MKLVYWVMDCEDDSKAYNIRAKTRKEALQIRSLYHEDARFSAPRKVQVEYRDAFHLLNKALGEGGIE